MVLLPVKPNILEIRYIAVQYSKDVFIYLPRARVFDLHRKPNVSRQRRELGVFALVAALASLNLVC